MKRDPGAAAWRLAHSCPFTHTLRRIGEVGADLDEARPEVGVVDVEVVDADPALFLHEVEADHGPAWSSGCVALNTHWNSWAATMATTPVRPSALGPLQVGADVVELAVVPARAVRLLQLQDRNLVLGGEGLHLAAETVADLLEQRPARGSGDPRCSVRNGTTWPPTCSLGTYAFR